MDGLSGKFILILLQICCETFKPQLDVAVLRSSELSHPIRKVENYQRYLFDNLSNLQTNSLAFSNIDHAVVDVVIPPSDNFSIVKSDSEDEEDSESEADADEGRLLF